MIARAHDVTAVCFNQWTSITWPATVISERNCNTYQINWWGQFNKTFISVTSWVTNYSFIFARNFSVNLWFHPNSCFTCEKTTLPAWQPTIRTSQCQCFEWRCQGIKRSFRKPKHTKEHIKKDSLGILSKILNLS